MTVRKLNQTITLPPGSEFEGPADLELNEGPEHIHGTVNGTITVPPFKTTLTVLGVPTPVEVGITFGQVGQVEGTITSLPRSACGFTQEQELHNGCLEVKSPATVNIGLTGPFALGLGLPTHCETTTPVVIGAHDVVSFLELLYYGVESSGKLTIPSLRCDGLEGPLLGPALTAAMSGPGNPYEVALTPPPGTIKPPPGTIPRVPG